MADDLLYWEDFPPGDTMVMGSHTFTREEIIAFARQFDPQPFHIDPEAAKNSRFGGLIASGWRWEAVNQRGETVMTMEGWGMFRRRKPAGP